MAGQGKLNPFGRLPQIAAGELHAHHDMLVDQVAEESDAETDSSLGLRELRSTADTVLARVTRARAAKQLFGATDEALVGRYVVLALESRGGMGIVYAAYDPELDRKVALKVVNPRHHTDGRARQRLQSEARTLAKLDHPNVVKVHDVVNVGDELVIVMEWVDGVTLKTWERAEVRSWREIVEVYAQAARGLAAAHGVEVIHRDFKPANVIVGGDGRVRVLDFGLSRFSSSDADAVREPGRDTACITQTGEIVGTVAYAAPEQLAGGVATAESDQFAFAVALHRALEGVAPFTGATASELCTSIEEGRADYDANADVPAWLRAAVFRALAFDPAKRFSSIEAMLKVLLRPRGWRRWRGAVAFGVASVIAGTTVALAARSKPAECDGAREHVAAVWNVAAREQVSATLGSLLGLHGDEVRARVLGGLDTYAEAWSARHREVCLAHRRGEESDAVLDHRIQCLQRRLNDLQSTVTVLASLDRKAPDNAVDAVAHLPSLAECANSQTPAGHSSDDVDGARASVIEHELSDAGALERIGRTREALVRVDQALVDARKANFSDAIVETKVLRGRILLDLREWKAADEELAAGRTLALERGLLPLAVEAAARQVYVEGTSPDLAASGEAESAAAIFVPLSKSLLGSQSPRALLLNNLGTERLANGDPVHARAYFQEARAVLDAVPDIDLELTCVDKNLAMLTPDPVLRESLARGVWQRLRTALGPSHLSTIDALDGYARYVADPRVAARLLTEECSLLDRAHVELVDERVACRSYLALLAEQNGDQAWSMKLLAEIVALEPVRSDDLIPASSRDLASGEIAFDAGDLERARAAFSATIERLSPRKEWWIALLAADARFGTARVDAAKGSYCAAAAELASAITTYRAATEMNEETEHRLRLDRASRVLEELTAIHHAEISERQCRNRH